jgi:hypothetical protein
MTLLKLVLLVFTLLVIFQFYEMLFKKKKIVEGAANQYQDPDLESDPLYLATVNAANITYLKSQIDNIQTLKEQIYDMSGQVQINASAIVGLNQSLSDASTDITGG